jgi:hypothetical protein
MIGPLSVRRRRSGNGAAAIFTPRSNAAAGRSDAGERRQQRRVDVDLTPLGNAPEEPASGLRMKPASTTAWTSWARQSLDQRLVELFHGRRNVL